MKITITIEPELNARLEDFCNKHGHKKSTYITFLINHTLTEREHIESYGAVGGSRDSALHPDIVKVYQDEDEYAKNGEATKAQAAKELLNKVENKLEPAQPRGKCPICGIPKELNEREVVYELERKKMNICDACFKMAARMGQV